MNKRTAPPLKGGSEMFDKLIESEPEGAEFKNRRTYFAVSSVVVGVLFVTAVVVSIFAAEIGLGNNTFEIVEMLAPVDMAAPEPKNEEPRPQPRAQVSSQLPSRQVNMVRVDETPPAVPSVISTVQNTVKARPQGDYDIAKFDSDPVGDASNGRNSDSSVAGGPSLAQGETIAKAEKEPEPEPPPVVKKEAAPRKPVSGGVVNGNATSLPKPIYSAAAKAVGAAGVVQVQVTIDETGRVISANAASGHVMLRAAAEDAARKARFTPTYLSGSPVKVTGVIVYNFTR